MGDSELGHHQLRMANRTRPASPFRGVFSTGVYTYDDGALFMPLSKAQAFTNTAGRASAVTMLLNDEEDADAVAAALEARRPMRSPGKLNELFLQTIETGMSFYVFIYGIVILIVAVIIANTLLMSVFERIREVGILAALGMKGRQITLMFLLEAPSWACSASFWQSSSARPGCLSGHYGIPTGDMGAAAAIWPSARP